MTSRRKRERAIEIAWERVERAIERPEVLEPRRKVLPRPPRIQLWMSSGRGGTRRWAALAPSKGDGLVVREVSVSPLLVGALRADPEITIEALRAQALVRVRDAVIAREELDPWIAAARRIAVPLVGIEVPEGVDGAMHGLVVHDSFQSVAISWWSEPPREWEALVRWADDLRALFEQRLDGA